MLILWNLLYLCCKTSFLNDMNNILKPEQTLFL